MDQRLDVEMWPFRFMEMWFHVNGSSAAERRGQEHEIVQGMLALQRRSPDQVSPCLSASCTTRASEGGNYVATVFGIKTRCPYTITKFFLARFGPTFRYLIRRNRAVCLRCCLLWVIWTSTPGHPSNPVVVPGVQMGLPPP